MDTGQLLALYFFQLLQLSQLFTMDVIETDVDHEIIYPYIQYTNHQREDERTYRRKRSANNYYGDYKDSRDKTKMKIDFNALGRDFKVDLDLNKKLLAPNFKIEILGEHGKVTKINGARNCYYTGRLRDDNTSLVSLSHCNGLEGIIQTAGEKISIKPFRHEDGVDGEPSSSKHRPHVVRRMNDEIEDALQMVDDVLGTDKYRQKRFLEEASDSSCGLDDLKPHIRWTRGIMSEKLGEQTIETMLTIDQKMTQYYGMDAAKQYALTIANVAHDILRDSTIGPNTVNMIISKLVILTSPLEDLTINHHARNSLASFGKWSDRRNNINTDHPDHYDYAVLFTKHDICVDKNQPCETKGLSYVGGMCDNDRSASIIEDDGFGAAFTLAHQTGHSLGMDHDGVGNTCGRSKHIMSTNGGRAEDAYHWSACSIDYLQQFLRKEQSKCLDNDAPRDKREEISTYKNPGDIYDADTQCRYAIGDKAKQCYEDDTDMICAELLCFNPLHNNCTRIGKPAMDGTPCGEGKWCKEAICVEKGIRDDLVVDGGWTQWSGFQPCSRTCGGGISYRERACQSPKPKHGGKYCEGESRMYIICNKEDCPAQSNFRRAQCENQSLSYYEDHLLNWTYTQNEPEASCDLKCMSTKNNLVTKLFGHAVDGTECAVSNIPGRCVRGECNTAGCDLVLGSTQRKDRCGVCGGDGSTCAEKIDLNQNPLAVSRSINNAEIVDKLAILEEKRSHHMQNVAKKLIELRNIMREVVKKKCDDDPECIGKFDINSFSKKESVESVPGRFQWVLISSGCSVSCGRGNEVMFPECRRVDDGTPVARLFCNSANKPLTLSKTCDRSPCPPSWKISKWSSCTRSCGGGTKRRSVYCVVNVGKEEYVLSTSQCDVEEQPKRLSACNLSPCQAEWFAEPYGACSTSCGVGVRTRSVVCKKVDLTTGSSTVLSDNACSHAPVPETEMICNAHNPCPGADECGSVWTDARGNISSPSYPNYYSDNQECVHAIKADEGKIVTLKFHDMDIVAAPTQFSGPKCLGDFLRITDGKCSEIGIRPSVKLCGKDAPGQFVSSGNDLCLKFVSDQSSHGQGFSLSYAIEDKPIEEQPVRDICDLKGKQINSSLGIVTSPNYPNFYPVNEDCKATFVSPDGSGFMLKFDAFQIGSRSGVMECKNDYLEVYYNDKAERICGKEPSIPTVHIPSTKFTMTFHSTHVKKENRGFVLTYVTKKYAKKYAVDKKTATKLQAYSQTINQWSQNRQPIAASNTMNQTIEPASSIKKSVLTKPTEGMIRDKNELVKVLLELSEEANAVPNPSSFVDVGLKMGETRTLHRALPNQPQAVNEDKLQELQVKSSIPKHTWQNSLPWGTPELSKLTPTAFKQAKTQQKAVDSLLNGINDGDIASQSKSIINKAGKPSLAYQAEKPSSVNQPQAIQQRMSMLPNALTRPATTAYESVKGLGATANSYRPSPLSRYSEAVSKPINNFYGTKESIIPKRTGPNKIDLNVGTQRTEKTLIPHPYLGLQKDVTTVIAKKSRITQPQTMYKKPETYAAPVWGGNRWYQNTVPGIVRNQMNMPQFSMMQQQYQPTAAHWQPAVHSQPIPSMYTQPYQPQQQPYWQQAVRRQYQSFPFMYIPHFGMFNNHCPPKSSFTCRDIVFHPVCNNDNDCLDLRLGCCETSCNYAQRVCVAKAS
ncbi:A disintegrin and metalloproteinase with thrombospondin motifs 16-like isoform X2 [Hydractinia symbiolongicarpus]|uniref:A disintegrin and metalloproteinase with thrombospondin motifs 16-like isoform X2 n=1 Tax=Hydractinia symbiolongicarpus TaxID=13093 RepID=UPI00255042F8|nr:A disintegrin and metalloproteinase with thrombospondin motifs 16-like isoform X2 [Hydractinia symbiolongicarpus]